MRSQRRRGVIGAGARPADRAVLDAVRATRGERENHLIDELAARRLSRREFTWRAVLLGMSAPLAGMVVAACGSDEESGAAQPSTPAGNGGGIVPPPGGMLRLGITTPGRVVDPWIMGSYGAVGLVGQTGEYLAVNVGEPELRPMLAESWTPNEDATVWTFAIRQGVTFTDGTPLTARDVAATFNRLADPVNGTNALETLQGVLSPGAASATDDHTVVFELDAPNGLWPWLASSDNTSAVILPESYDGGWDQSWIGTGPWRLQEYTPEVRAVLVRNEDYWGPVAVADELSITMFEDSTAMTLALQSGDVDTITSFTVAEGQAILGDEARYRANVLRSSGHNPVNLRCLDGPFADKRVRRALALCLNRQQLVDQLLDGYADLGNDSPFAPVFSSTNSDVPQREQDLEEARRLLAEAGAEGTRAEVVVWDVAANADFAQLMQGWAAEVGIELSLTLQDTTTFLGTGEFGSSPQLDSIASVADWGSRGVPNTFLTSQLSSGGVRNAAHWYNDRFDSLYAEFAAEADVQRQIEIAGQLQELLLDETPMIYPFFPNFLTASQATIEGVVPTSIGHILMNEAGVAAS